ncbi:MAG: DUF4350 domain-containing protein [Acidobacteria bacterium]|nr:DUF4350 domain-containing protein [Acidobacteriota bacterium]
MRQRLAIVITIVVVLVLLIALNASSYVRIEKSSDQEAQPDRSTYNSGATGTRALYDFLQESGRETIRWTEAPISLLNQPRLQKATFVLVGQPAIPVKKEEAADLLRWVEAGGRLVIVDRSPSQRLLPSIGRWQLTTQLTQYPTSEVLADNPEQMTEGVQPQRPTQPTLLTRHVESVMPSRFASLINFYARDESKPDAQPTEQAPELSGEEEEEESTPPPPRPSATQKQGSPDAAMKQQSAPAPVTHIHNERGALLVDYRHGEGQIILLSDPFIIANNGISRADNLQLALNVVAGRTGAILFDEYHQGHAAARNRLVAYFAGTPVLAMFGQFALIVVAVMWTRGRRFARPLPLAHVDRRSKLEYVASMAELQQRSRAYDLAIENIYTRTRRVLARYAGADNKTPRGEIAARVAARSRLDRHQLETLMRHCEDAINGQPITATQSLALVAGLREVERTLGLRMRAREIRQAKEQGVKEQGVGERV